MPSFTRKQYDDACALLAPMLQPRCQQALAASFKEDIKFEAALKEAVFAGHAWNRYATSVRGLTHLMTDVLSDRYRMHLVDLASRFDRMSGLHDQHVSDTFVQTATADYWASKIVHALAMGAVEAVVEKEREEKEQEKEKEKEEEREEKEKEEKEKVEKGKEEKEKVEKGKETKKENAKKEQKQDPKIKTCPCAITDVHLSGPSIKEAWQANPVLRDLENNATWPVNLAYAWKPESASRKPVYISTVAPFKGDNREQSDIRLAMVLANFDALPRVVDGRAMPNRLVPDSLPVVWTVYSPLRAFLWSLFHTEVITNTYGVAGNNADNRQRSWDCLRLMPVAPHTHKGVVLLTFRPDTSDRSLVYSVPRDRTPKWYKCKRKNAAAMAADSTNGASPADFWKRYARLRKKVPGITPKTDWPRALHFYDAKERAITTQAWQTAWHGEGIKTLNSACDSMMCITFECTAVEEEKGENEKKKEKSTGKGCCIIS